MYLGAYEKDVGEPNQIGISSSPIEENIFLINSSLMESLDSDNSSLNFITY